MATFAPHVERAVKEINARFPALGPGGTYPNHGEDEPGGLPEEFYNADFWSTVKSVHDEAFPWIIANAKRLGLHYVISWDRIWNIDRADEGVRHYERDANNDGVLSPSERHTNHLHTAFFETPPEEDMPSLEEIADYLARDDEFKQAVATAVWQKDGTVNNVGFASGTEGRYVNGSTSQTALMERILGLNSKLDAILAKLP